MNYLGSINTDIGGIGKSKSPIMRLSPKPRVVLGGIPKKKTPIIGIFDPFKDGSGKALYSFNGDANDVGGNYNGTPSNVTYSSGKFGMSAMVSGGYINLGVGSSSLMPSSSSYSVSAWIKKDIAQRYVIASRHNSSIPYGDFLVLEADNKFYMGFALSSNSMPTSLSPICTVFNDLSFHHVVITVDRENRVCIVYVDNNVFYITNALFVPTSSYNNGLNTLIGGFHDVSYYTKQDETHFFNKALTKEEVKALYYGFL